MEKYSVIILPEAQKDIRKISKSGDKSSLLKIEKMIVELAFHPYEGTGKPEKLKHNYSGYWSRRINKKDRLVYKVEEEIVTVFVVSALGHYEER
ncbi:toxin YoeB [Cruoricaptor ignavus]|uniref:Putative mRNA interferase YoeB n=1 Tax=Cruoricaptor ignavus TaxID=1118202 RepID=A0A1M6A4S1_9FLAO|nr:Txe/YoeB family addiction module toxin [Cruoricaptor ignavus]QOR74688.1 Txe/YoeB family addiction module toxin [Cruoricaptor ignavus]SHI31163.1 toxin YoeB [Cruoricaptor ignavus]